MKLSQGEFIERLVKEGHFDKKAQAERALKAVFGGIGDVLKKGKTITISGFGTFSVKDRKAREGRNPQTGEAIKIPKHKAPHFKFGAVLKREIR